MGAVDARRPRQEGRHLSDPAGPGWYPDPWQPGGWRYHDGTTWTSWTGPPPVPAGYGPRPTSAADVESEGRLRVVGQLAIVALAVAVAAGGIGGVLVVRDLFDPLLDLLRTTNPTDAEIDAAVDEVQARQGEYWWLNIVGLVPAACLAGMAVWANRVASVARGLGYPARHSPGWAAAGWFVPVVNLWFPYQSLVDSISPTNPDRRVVLRWWLLYTVGSAATFVAALVLLVADVPEAAVLLPVGLVAIPEAVLGLRVVDLVHEDHARAVRVP